MSIKNFNQDNLTKYPKTQPYNKTKLDSVVIQICYNDVIKDKYALIPVYKTLMSLTGQKPKILKAKDSIAAFKIRKNMEIGLLVTIRNSNLTNILNLIKLNLPKFKLTNFNISLKNFDIFYPNDLRSGASIYFNVSTKGSNRLEKKNYYLSSLHLY